MGTEWRIWAQSGGYGHRVEDRGTEWMIGVQSEGYVVLIEYSISQRLT